MIKQNLIRTIDVVVIVVVVKYHTIGQLSALIEGRTAIGTVFVTVHLSLRLHSMAAPEFYKWGRGGGFGVATFKHGGQQFFS